MTMIGIYLSGGKGRERFEWKGETLTKAGVKELLKGSDVPVTFRTSNNQVILYPDSADGPSVTAIDKNRRARHVKFSTMARTLLKKHTVKSRNAVITKYEFKPIPKGPMPPAMRIRLRERRERSIKTKAQAPLLEGYEIVYVTFVLVAKPEDLEETMFSKAAVKRAREVESADKTFRRELEKNMFKYQADVRILEYKYANGVARAKLAIKSIMKGETVKSLFEFNFTSDGWDFQYGGRYLGPKRNKLEYSAYVRKLRIKGQPPVNMATYHVDLKL